MDVRAVMASLAALLRWHQETRTPLSAWEKREATLMITRSDNDAATALWNRAGLRSLRRFLSLAGWCTGSCGRRGPSPGAARG